MEDACELGNLTLRGLRRYEVFDLDLRKLAYSHPMATAFVLILVVSCLLVLALSRATSAFAFRPTLAGAACFAGMLASTLIGNVPINTRVLEISLETEGEEFVELRRRWDRLHTLCASYWMWPGWGCCASER